LIISALFPLLMFTVVAGAQQSGRPPEVVARIRADLKANPGETIDRLNKSVMAELMEDQQYAAVEDLATAGTLALPADTWRIEGLQSFRVRALLAEHKSDDALHAAKGLFNVCGLGFVKDALPLLCNSLGAARANDPGIVARFKRQIIAGAQEDIAERKSEMAKFGGNIIMMSIPADPAPYQAALAGRKTLKGWRDRYGTGNLLLLSGKIKEAREVFTNVYSTRPSGELRYASEAIAKLIKAEDGGLGRANQFVRSIKPK